MTRAYFFAVSFLMFANIEHHPYLGILGFTIFWITFSTLD